MDNLKKNGQFFVWRNPKHLGIILAAFLLISILVTTQTTFAENSILPGTSQNPDGVDTRPEAVWQRVTNLGSYSYSTDIIQKHIPLALLTNVGRTSKQDALHIEGSANLPNQTMNMVLWSTGGNVLDAASGYEIKVENNQAFGRQGGLDWKPIDNFVDWAAPNGDFMSFVSVSKNIVEENVPSMGGSVLRLYTFDIDGPTFAEQTRQRMQSDLAAQGKLPPGIEFGLSEYYANMTGTGKLWVDPDGLPVRQVIELHFPPQADFRTEAVIDTSFSQFDREKLKIASTPPSIAQISTQTWNGLKTSAPTLLGNLLFFSLLFGMVLNPYSKKVVAAVSLVLILSIVVTPLLQSSQVAAFYAEQNSQQTPPVEEPVISSENHLNPPIGANPLIEQLTLPLDTGPRTEPAEASQMSPIPAPGSADSTRSITDFTLNSDKDSLKDYQEERLGTDPLSEDTDQDGLWDDVEVAGFELDGKQWFSDPLTEDTNGDGLFDGQEWIPDLPPFDTDGNGIPDLFDADNDGDGVPDKQDISPFQGNTTIFTASQPFSLLINHLTPNKPTFVEIQLRPTNESHLWYSRNVLDWPHDDKGQIQDTTNKTFYDVCMESGGTNCNMNPDQNGDVRLVPMLEIKIDSVPSNLPLINPKTTIDVIPLPGQVDAPTGSVTMENSILDLKFSFDVAPSTTWWLQEGTCSAPGRYTVWTGTATDTVQTFKNAKLSDFADGNHIILFGGATAGAAQSCAQIPLLPFEVTKFKGTKMVDVEQLQRYGITVRDLNTDHAGKVVYLPLNLVGDPETGENTAFQAEMLYLPTGSWGAAHQMRMVWAVTMLTDSNDDDLSNDDIPRIIHTYSETWRLTGLDVREDNGVEQAIVYEDPSIPGVDPNFTYSLNALANGLGGSFLAGRACSGYTSDSDCIPSNQRDITIQEIYKRFNHATNYNDYDITTSFGISNTLSVDKKSYPSFYESVIDTVQVTTPKILNANFVWSSTDPITPTLLFASEISFRAQNLDSLLASDIDTPTTTTINWEGSQLTVSMNDSDINTIASVKMMPYCHTGDGWRHCSPEEYWNELSSRYQNSFVDEEIDEDVADGMLYYALLWFLVLYNGVQRTVQSGDDPQMDLELSLGDSLIQKLHDPKLYGTAGKVTAKALIPVFNDFWMAANLTGRIDATYRTIGNRFQIVFKEIKNYVSGALESSETPTTTKLQKVKDFIKKIPLKVKIIGAVVFATAVTAYILVQTDTISSGAGLTLFMSVIAVIAVALAIEETAKAVSSAVKTTTGLAKRLSAVRSTLKYSRYAAIVGAVIELVVTWGIFFFQWGNGDFRWGSSGFASALANAIAGSIVIGLYLAIAYIPIVGEIIVGLLVLTDLILTLLCQVDVLKKDETGTCFTISGWLTENIASFFYSETLDAVFDYEDPVYFQDFNISLENPDAGFVVGSGVTIGATLGFFLPPNLTMPIYENMLPYLPYRSGFEQDGLRVYESFEYTMDVPHELGGAPQTLTSVGPSQVLDPAFRNTGSIVRNWDSYIYTKLKDGDETIGYFFALLNSAKVKYSTVLEKEGRNQPVPLYFSMYLPVKSVKCWHGTVNGCEPESTNQLVSEPLGNEGGLFFDVLPTSVEEFANWTEITGIDRDGDGLLSGFCELNLVLLDYFGPCGNDPDDALWDTDGDGLSDAVEVEQQGQGKLFNTREKDADSDGVCDADELKFGTDPVLSDTDGDGLLDGEEVFHLDCTTGSWTGGWDFTIMGETNSTNLTVLVTSDPILADTDGDGINDALEKNLHLADPAAFPFNPGIFDPSPLGLYQYTNDFDNHFRPGESFIYTQTLQNNLAGNYYASGRLTSTFPAALGGSTISNSFDLFRGEAQSSATLLTTSGDTQYVTVNHDIIAALRASDGTPIAGDLSSVSADPFEIVIDNDRPTSVLTHGNYIKAGTAQTIGGTASDPTSGISKVEVSLDGKVDEKTKWIPTGEVIDGIRSNNKEAWSYTLLARETEEKISLLSRATDAVGNAQSPATLTTILVDAQPPTLITDQKGNPFIGVRPGVLKWALPLSGKVSDPLIGTDPGSGIGSVQVMVTSSWSSNHNNWQTAILDLERDGRRGEWQVNYNLPTFDDFNAAIIDPSGQYTITVRATDAVGNQTAVENYLIYPVRVDAVAPTVTMADPLGVSDPISTTSELYINTKAPVITQNLTLHGEVAESGDYASGVKSVEIAFTPAEMVDSLAAPSLQMFLNDPQSSTTFKDLAEHTATCTDDRCPAAAQPGIFGTAVAFDGRNDVITVTAVISETDFTTALWFNTSCPDCGIFSVVEGPLGSAGSDREIFLSGGNVCTNVLTALPDTRNTICSASGDYADGNWHQVVQVVGSSGHYLYLDGVLQAQNLGTTASALTTQTGLTLGFTPQSPTSEYFSGRLDEVAVYPAAFTSDQVASLYYQWQPVTLAKAGTDVITTTWSYTIPRGLEGYYQIDLRSEDMVANRNDETRAEWTQWRGVIDTLAPRISLDLEYMGVIKNGYSRITGVAFDKNLDQKQFSNVYWEDSVPPFACTNAIRGRVFDDSDWWAKWGGGLEHLVQLKTFCTMPGWIPQERVDQQACDKYGNCAAGTVAQLYKYWVSVDYREFPFIWEEYGESPWLSYPDYAAVQGVKILRQPLDSYIQDKYDAVDLLFEGSPSETVLAKDNTLIQALIVDPDSNTLYWTQLTPLISNSGEIWRANLDGSNPQQLISGLSIPGTFDAQLGLAIDTNANKLYWTEGKGVWWANLDGSNPAQIVSHGPGVYDTAAIILDENRNKIIWLTGKFYPASGPPDSWESQIDTFAADTIWQANLDGTGEEKIYELTYPSREKGIRAIALGVDPDELYWSLNDKIFITYLSDPGKYPTPTASFGPLNTLLYTSIIDHPEYPGYPNAMIKHGVRYYSDYSHYGGLSENYIGAGWDGPAALALLPGGTVTQSDLRLEMSDLSGVAVQGSPLSYLLRVSNHGRIDAHNPIVITTLSDQASFVSAAPASANCTADGQVVTCKVDRIARNKSVDIVLTTQVEPTATGTLTSTASVSSLQSQDLDLTNNDQITATPIIAPLLDLGPDWGTLVYMPFGHYPAASIERFRVDHLSDLNEIHTLITGNKYENFDDPVVDAIEEKIYFVKADHTIVQANLDGSGQVDFYNNPDSTLKNIVFHNGKVYWLESDNMIRRKDTSSAVMETVIDYSGVDNSDFDRIICEVYPEVCPPAWKRKPETIYTFAIHPIFGTLTWIDDYTLSRSSLDGTNRELLRVISEEGDARRFTASISEFWDARDIFPYRQSQLSIDPYEGRMYWIDYERRIMTSYLNGSGLETFTVGNVIKGLALDLVHRQIYWLAYHDPFLILFRSNLDGSGRGIILWHDTSEDGGKLEYPQTGLALANLYQPLPTAVPDTGATDEDTLLSVPSNGVLANDIDPNPGLVLQVTSHAPFSEAGAAVVVNPNGSYTYNPTTSPSLQALLQDAMVTDTFSYTISYLDGFYTSTTVAITVTGRNELPVAVDDFGSTNEDTLLTVTSGSGVLINDTDGDAGDSKTVTSYSPTSTRGALISMDAEGGYTYDPRSIGAIQALPGSWAFPFEDTFTYTVTDNHGGSAVGTVYVSLEGRNDPPVANPDTDSVNEGSNLILYDIVLISNDTDLDEGDSPGLTGVAATSELGVPASIDPWKTEQAPWTTIQYKLKDVSGFPVLNLGDTITDTLTYTITDMAATRAAGTVVITIIGLNDAPTAVQDNNTTNEDTVLSVPAKGVLENDFDINSDAISVSSFDSASAAGARVVVGTDGSYTYDPTTSVVIQALTVGDILTDTFAYVAEDTHGDRSSTLVQIIVSGLNDAPTVVNDLLITSNDAVRSITAPGVLGNDTDPDTGDSLQVAPMTISSTLSANVSILADGSYTYDPSTSAAIQALASGGSITDTFTYSVGDGVITQTAQVAVAIKANRLVWSGSQTLNRNPQTPCSGTSCRETLLTLPSGDINGMAVDNASEWIYYTWGSEIQRINFAYTLTETVVSGLSEPYDVVLDSKNSLLYWTDRTAGLIQRSDLAGSGVVTLASGLTNPMHIAVDVVLGMVFWNQGNSDRNIYAAALSGASLGTPSTIYTLSGSDYTAGASCGLVESCFGGIAIGPAGSGGETKLYWTEYGLPAEPTMDGTRVKVCVANDCNATRATLVGNLNALYGDPGDLAIQSPTGGLETAVLYLAIHSENDVLDPSTAPLATPGNLWLLRDNLVPADGIAPTVLSTGLTMTYTGEIQLGLEFDAAEINDDLVTTDEDTSLHKTIPGVLVNDKSPFQMRVVAYDAVSAQGAAVQVLPDGSYVYTPTVSATLNALDVGAVISDTFGYTAGDDLTFSSAVVTIRVSGKNDAPVAQDNEYYVDEDTFLAFNPTEGVLNNDYDPDSGDELAALQVRDTSLYSATITLKPNGSFDYDPRFSSFLDRLSAGEMITDTFQYILRDSHNVTSTAVARLFLSGVNDYPIAVQDTGATSESSLLTQPAPGVLDNDLELDRLDSLTVSDFSATSLYQAGVTVGSDGSYTYDPRSAVLLRALMNGATLTDVFTYTLSDGNGGEVNGEVHIVVTGDPNQAPIAADDEASVDEDTVLIVPINGVLANDTDPNIEDVLQVTDYDASSQYGAVVEVSSTGGYTYNPTAAPAIQALSVGDLVIDTFQYTIYDGNGLTATAVVSVSLSGVNDLPIAAKDFYTTTKTAIMDIETPGVLGNDSDADADDILKVNAAVISSTLGGEVVLDPLGSFTYNPLSSATLQALGIGAAITDTFAYTVTDGTASASTLVQVHVTGLSEACRVFPDIYEIDDTYTQAITVTVGGASLGHTFHTLSDQDWITFYATKGTTYKIQTWYTEPSVDTTLALYDTDGTSLIVSNDDTDGKRYSTIEFTASESGYYFVKAENKDPSICYHTYDLTIKDVPPAPVPFTPFGYTPPLLFSALITPTFDTLLTSLDETTLVASAFARDELRAITVTLNGADFAADSWARGAYTNTLWTLPWTPPAEGVYTFTTTVSDWAGRVQTQTLDTNVFVDLSPPVVTLDTTVVTSTHLVSPGWVHLAGAASDNLGIAAVEVNVAGTGWQTAHYSAGLWYLPWSVSRIADGTSVPVEIRAIDTSGRETQISDSVWVDVDPPNPVDLILEILDGGLFTPITPTQSISQAYPTLRSTWTASSRGGSSTAAAAGYYVGWTSSPTGTLSALTFYTGAAVPHLQTLGEAEVVYAHLISVDEVGNQQVQTYGPFYIDGPATPDLIKDLNYHGWMESGASQLAIDREISKSTYAFTPRGSLQSLYASWDADALRIAWRGADWDHDGDLFVYLDTSGGGAEKLYSPYPSTLGTEITFPTSFSPDLLIWGQSSITATVMTWDGAGWVYSQTLSSSQYRSSKRTTDILLPFDLAGLSSGASLGLLAVASEDDGLRLWAAAPDRNPLNSSRVTSALAQSRDLDTFALRHYFTWPSLGSGVLPNAGRFENADLNLTITASSGGVAAGYLESDLLDLLEPGVPLDADGDGALDIDLPIGAPPAPLYDGQTVEYTLEYANNGPFTVTQVTVDLAALGALKFPAELYTNPNNLVVDLGDIGPGITGTHQITAVVDASRNPDSAELDVVFADSTHGDYEWFWMHNSVDVMGPTNLEILSPLAFVRPLTQTVSGTATDPAGVASITLEVLAYPGGGPADSIACPVDFPFAGSWNCLWNAGEVAGINTFQIRAQAVDRFGNLSEWTDWITLVVDNTPPTITLDAALDAALADGFMSADEARVSGQVVDDNQATGFERCGEIESLLVCVPGSVAPGTAVVGRWAFLVETAGLDGVTSTLTLRGVDVVGNRSALLERTIKIDAVPPAITVTQLLNTVDAFDYVMGSLGSPVLSGEVSDGGGVGAVYVRMTAPGGAVVRTLVPVIDGAWTFTPSFNTGGIHRLRVEAHDQAGNISVSDSFWLTVSPIYQVLLPIVFKEFTSGPDLVVESIFITSDDVQVVIRNQGNTPLVDEFWVDLYINPDPIPTGVNQTWDQLSSQGLVWGVTDVSALVPGGTLTLNLGHPSYIAKYSNFSGSFTPGVPVYVQVDSANIETDYGNVWEIHEIQNSTYNNIYGPAFASSRH